MTRPSPGPEAMDRLRLSGERELLSFVNEVRTKSNKELLRVLPSVDGFRKDSVNSLPTRKRTMLTHFLKKAGGSTKNKSTADGTYYYFWRSWAEEHLAEVEGLEEALDAVEKAVPKDGLPSEELEAAVEQLFRKLQEQSFLNRCSAETIERLLHFSPFAITDAVDRVAAGSKPRIAVEKDRALSTLPDRLKGDEELLERLQQRVDQLAEEVSHLVTGLSERDEEPPPVTEAMLGDTNERIADLTRQVQALEERQQEKAHVDESAARLQALEKNVGDLEALWADMDDRARTATTELSRQLAALSVPAAVSAQTSSAHMPAQSNTSALLQVLSVPSAESVTPLMVAADAIALLAKNLLSIGLKSSGAAVFAQEAVVAAVTSKVMFLKGSMAPDVARVVAASLAATHTRRIRVPMGYVDASYLDRDVLETIPSTRESATVVLLDRINNAPLEVFADAIDDIVRVPNVFVVGTLSEGVSALPEHHLYLHYGPVFDTDALDWSLFAKAGAATSAGALVNLDPVALSMDQSKARPSNEELLRLLRKFPGSSTRLERTAVAYMGAMEAFRKTAEPTSLQSVAFGWIWPLWRMLGLDWDQCDEQLAAGKVDGESADQRLAALLAKHRPEQS